MEITDEIRNKVKMICTQMHEMFSRKHTPKVKRSKSCNACSLKDICLPKLMKNISVHDYIENKLKDKDI